ncbi:MAG TPA: hypothetical protein VFH48_24815 [Chloroflexota bacterium]|nr:hypothetical protein [Chloroflexota bacterium]
MQADRHNGPLLAGGHDDGRVSDASVQAALASIPGSGKSQQPPRPGELKWKLTTLVLPSIMLLFVALYVTCLSAGAEPEMALFQAGGVSVVLAVLGRVAVSILGDEARFILNDDQISAMAQSGSVRDYISGANADQTRDGAEDSSMAAQAAGPGGKE